MTKLNLRADIHKVEGGFMVEQIPTYYSIEAQIEMVIEIINNNKGNWMINIMNYKVSFCGKEKIDFNSLYNAINNFFIEYKKEMHDNNEEWKTIIM